MTCPEEIRSQVLTILSVGLRNILVSHGTKRYERCFIEANHIHNLPDLIENFLPRKLKYYLEVEVPQYLRESDGKAIGEIRAAWEVLQRCYNQISEPS